MNVVVLCQDTCGPLFQQPLETEVVGEVDLSEQLRQPCPLALENSRCLSMTPLGQRIGRFLTRACISGSIAYETVCVRHCLGIMLGSYSAGSVPIGVDKTAFLSSEVKAKHWGYDPASQV